MGSGYTHCACRDCFDETISSDTRKPELCSECEDAGCSADGDCDCFRPDAYGCDDWDDDERGFPVRSDREDFHSDG